MTKGKSLYISLSGTAVLWLLLGVLSGSVTGS